MESAHSLEMATQRVPCMGHGNLNALICRMGVGCKACRWFVWVREHDPGPSRTLQKDSIASDKCRLLTCTQGSKFSMANDDPEEVCRQASPAWDM